MMRGEAIAAVPLAALKDALLSTSSASTFNEEIETMRKVKDCGSQAFISQIKYQKRGFSSPKECYVLTHWRVLENGAFLICNQDVTTAEDSAVPPPGGGYTRAAFRIEGWIATPLPRGPDGLPATNLVYVVESDLKGRSSWFSSGPDTKQPLQVSKVIYILLSDPETINRYTDAPPLRNAAS
jgi:hypothetical protein